MPLTFNPNTKTPHIFTTNQGIHLIFDMQLLCLEKTVDIIMLIINCKSNQLQSHKAYNWQAIQHSPECFCSSLNCIISGQECCILIMFSDTERSEYWLDPGEIRITKIN